MKRIVDASCDYDNPREHKGNEEASGPGAQIGETVTGLGSPTASKMMKHRQSPINKVKKLYEEYINKKTKS